MIVFNFSHPLTDKQKEQLERLLDCDVNGHKLSVEQITCQMDIERPFAEQVVEMVDSCDVTPDEWQKIRFVVVLPALSTAAALLLSELHGRCGYYPPAIRLKKKADTLPPEYVVAEILDLDSQRQLARSKR